MPDEGGGDEEGESNPYDVPLPEGFKPPNGVEDGQEFDFAAKGHVENGKLCIDSIMGIPTGAGKEESGEEPQDNEGDDEGQEASGYAQGGRMEHSMSGTDESMSGMDTDSGERRTRMKKGKGMEKDSMKALKKVMRKFRNRGEEDD